MEQAVAARPQQKGLLQGDQGAVDRAGRGERSEKRARLVARAAEFCELRKIVPGGDMDERKRLVVAQQHIVARHQPLDQVAFEQQRFGLGRGNDDFQCCRLGHHAPQPVRQPGRMGIVLYPALQIARLADIDGVALAVEHAVDARAVRDIAQRRPQYRHAGRDPAADPASRSRLSRRGVSGEIGGAAAWVQRRRLAPTRRGLRR